MDSTYIVPRDRDILGLIKELPFTLPVVLVEPITDSLKYEFKLNLTFEWSLQWFYFVNNYVLCMFMQICIFINTSKEWNLNNDLVYSLIFQGILLQIIYNIYISLILWRKKWNLYKNLIYYRKKYFFSDTFTDYT